MKRQQMTKLLVPPPSQEHQAFSFIHKSLSVAALQVI